MAVLDGGGCVAADRVAVAGGFLLAEAAGYFLLCLRGAQVAFGLQSMPTRLASGRMDVLEPMDVMHQDC